MKLKKPSLLSWFIKNPEDSSQSGSCGSECAGAPNGQSFSDKNVNRRQALGMMFGAVATGVAIAKDSASLTAPAEKAELSGLKFDEYFKQNYRVMSAQEKAATVERLERIAALKKGPNVQISSAEAQENVLFGYAFNVGKCQGYMDCVKACVEENNQDRSSNMQYIKIWEVENGKMKLEGANSEYNHEVPMDGSFYLGTQCFHCEYPPCTEVCPVGATWREKDGIVVVDYDWCIGCRYCEAACPYFGRRFNWNEPKVLKDEVNTQQHYLGNRERKKGVMEKCTFCIQRSRSGQNPACVEACPTGSRIFGNLLDPNSDIRRVLATKKVFRLKEELGTEPKFWYFMD